MSDGTKIEWTEATANVINGCSVLSPGCTNCYAMRLAGTRLKHHPSREGLTVDTKAGPVWNGQVRFHEPALQQVLQWKRGRKIFWNAHGDMFHENVPDAWIDRCFAVMALTPQHIHQVLTKRSARMREYLTRGIERWNDLSVDTWEDIAVEMTGSPCAAGIRDEIEWPLSNVHMGISAEDQERANERVPDLLRTPAAVRWVSAEPLLGPIDFREILETGGDEQDDEGRQSGWYIDALKGDAYDDINGALTGEYRETFGKAKIDWIVTGGESGPGARPMHPDWVRSIRDQCVEVGISTAFLHKQNGDWTHTTQLGWFDPMLDLDKVKQDGKFYRVGKKVAGRLLDGVQHDGYPA